MSKGTSEALIALRTRAVNNATVLYDRYLVAINECHRADEVKQIRDKALALEQYARQAQNIEAERKAIEIRIRAERRAGQLLAEMEKSKGGRPEKNSLQRENSFYKEEREKAHISENQAARWQRLAAMPSDDFEGKLQDPLIKPTTTGLIDTDKPKPASDRALWLWGQLRDFERKGILNDDVNEIIEEMSEALQSDTRRIVAEIIGWLQSLKET